jgi:hypothetical protein
MPRHTRPIIAGLNESEIAQAPKPAGLLGLVCPSNLTFLTLNKAFCLRPEAAQFTDKQLEIYFENE